MARILVVEDERIVARDIEATLQQLGYDVVDTVGTGEAAVEAVNRLRPDLVMMDIHLGDGIDGVEAAERIRLRHTTPVIFLTAFTDAETLSRAKITEPYGYIVKPFEDREVHTAIEIGLYRHRVEAEVARLNAWLSTLLRCMGDGVIGLDAAGNINYLNPKAAEMLGVSADDAGGQPWPDVLVGAQPRDQEALAAAIAWSASVGGRTGLPRGTRIRCGDDVVPVGATVTATVDGSGIRTGTVVVLHDLRLAEQVGKLKVEVNTLRQRLQARASQLV